ncbi:hypothetical protein AJ80_08859 [Polytolypa hystricis UAMH7299]|uniref:Transferase n=1 Tax=Polytolypa hystricis (strain UAMH7299) TaxID=1447883 RepID=A0A2B7X0M3_POLH7|nr:hypothetical protein AJ80_08859 [Polytolypa hystricis UAMH7299]
MASKTVYVALTPLDHLHQPNYVKLCYYLPLKPNVSAQDVYADLSKGLRKTFVQLPWLGGKVHNQAPDTPRWRPGQREIRYEPVSADGPPPHQLRYKELSSDLTYAELKEEGFPSDVFDDEDLLAVPVEGDLEAGCDIFVAQANFIPGACVLCMSTCHAAIDGTAMVIVMKAWADNCRSLYEEGAEAEQLPVESFDRNLLDRLWEQEGSRNVPAESADWWTKGLVGLEFDRSDNEDATTKKFNGVLNGYKMPSRLMTNRTFYMSSANIAALQKECNDADTDGGDALSSNDVVTALMWRSLVRARAAAASPDDTSLSAESVLESAIDGRTDFSQAVPPSYMGNITFYNQAQLQVADLQDPSVPLGQVARVIRAGAGRVNSASLQEGYSLIRAVPDYRVLRPRFRRLKGADMLISNLLLFPVNDIVFGSEKFGNSGRAEAVRCFMGQFNHAARVSFVLPRRSAGGIELSMNLYEEEMDSLLEDDDFGRFCLPL